MFDKAEFEKKLNSDAEFLKLFLLNPEVVLLEAGLALSEDSAKILKSQLAELKGKDLPSGTSVEASGIRVSLGKSF